MPTRRRSLTFESLETRRLLAGDATFLTAAEIASSLKGHSLTGATIVTHGFQFSEGAGGDSLMPLAQAVRARADHENGVDAAAWLLDYDIIEVDGSFVGKFDIAQSVLPAAGGSLPGHVVLLFDWARESNETSAGWGEAAGDALFNLVVELGLAAPAGKTTVPLHFIGHSFGTAVTSEAVERLAAYDLQIDQVTYLDPHDFDQSLIPVDGDQRLFTLGQPDGYGATVWQNVAFTDVLYQTDGVLVIPNGRPIPGAFNRLVNDQVNSFNPHSEVWELYQTTVSDHSGSSGYAFSRVVGGTRPDLHAASSSPHWFHSIPSSSQDHVYSVSPLKIGDVTLKEEEANFFQAQPSWRPLSIANGDFQNSESASVFPGWLNHGGHGSGEVQCQAENCYLELVASKEQRTHNRLYVPASAVALIVDVRRMDGSNDDELLVEIDDQVVASLSLDGTDDAFLTRAFNVPIGFRGKSQSVKFQIVSTDGSIDSQVWIDNVRFGAWQNPAIATDVSGDRIVVPNDVLLVINEINKPKVSGADGKLLLPPSNAFGPPFYDVDGDDYVAPFDVLRIINHINREIAEGESDDTSRVAAEGEGDGWSLRSLDAFFARRVDDQEIIESLTAVRAGRGSQPPVPPSNLTATRIVHSKAVEEFDQVFHVASHNNEAQNLDRWSPFEAVLYADDLVHGRATSLRPET